MATSISQLIENFDSNMDYEESNSVTKAKAFVTACRGLIGRRPNSANHDGSGVGFDPNQLRMLMQDAMAFVRSRSRNRAKYLGVDPRRG